MKRIITIQDVSCVGKCSLTVALPIISAMGVEAAILPTAVLSTHTMFKEFTFRDLTDDIKPIMEHWKREKIGFDAIYTGYLGSFEQLRLMEELFESFRGEKTSVIVDPCMADNGKLYPGFSEEFAKAMGKLCSKADIIVPNLTEASFMLGIPYVAEGYDEEYIVSVLKKLSALGAKKVVLKGISFDKDQKSLKNVSGRIGIATYDSESGSIIWYFHERMSQNYHGTGDIFSSIIVGNILNNIDIKKNLDLATDFIVDSILNTIEDDQHNYGVHYEEILKKYKDKDE